MTTTIAKSYRFEAAHWLPNVPDGHKCKTMHGHNYKVVISLTGNTDERGFVMDFAEMDEQVAPLIWTLDHSCLNDTIVNPTAEIIAEWLLSRLGFAASVRVYENEDCWAEITA